MKAADEDAMECVYESRRKSTAIVAVGLSASRFAWAVSNRARPCPSKAGTVYCDIWPPLQWLECLIFAIHLVFYTCWAVVLCKAGCRRSSSGWVLQVPLLFTLALSVDCALVALHVNPLAFGVNITMCHIGVSFWLSWVLGHSLLISWSAAAQYFVAWAVYAAARQSAGVISEQGQGVVVARFLGCPLVLVLLSTAIERRSRCQAERHRIQRQSDKSGDLADAEACQLPRLPPMRTGPDFCCVAEAKVVMPEDVESTEPFTKNDEDGLSLSLAPSADESNLSSNIAVDAPTLHPSMWGGVCEDAGSFGGSGSSSEESAGIARVSMTVAERGALCGLAAAYEEALESQARLSQGRDALADVMMELGDLQPRMLHKGGSFDNGPSEPASDTTSSDGDTKQKLSL
eukprot:TRINITY_DN2539_c2_g1_i1.p1 TRINITY_DN2539_c2_g1~~TRINITY_DN2539_c2_g1_i1.p1  ORF type:complete len:402 (-),score=27.02 TRINITY_DN2539_c2_g1_i1:182-1387(-)